MAIKLSKQLSYLATFCALAMSCTASAPLPASFYKEGPGVIIEKWLSSTTYSFDSFKDIPDYPDCPTYVLNSATFDNADVYANQKQHSRYRAIFVSKQTGKHKFFAICNNKCQLHIEINPKGFIKILEENSHTNDDWNTRKWSSEVILMKGFRYELVAYHYGNGGYPDFFRLGVQFPDQTEVKPISNTYMRRSMEYYKWKGLIAQKYDNFNFPDWSLYSLAYAYSNNPNYPDNPSSFTCKSSLYDPYQYQDFGNRYALRYIGYLKVPANASYQLKMWCNEICDFFITKNNVETSLGQFVIRNYSNPSSKIMKTGLLSTQLLYPIKAFMAEESGSDYIRIQHKYGSSSYSGSWSGMLQNLETVETTKNVPVPVLTTINSTSISVRFLSTPFLPPRDNWQYIANHEILYYISGNEETVQKTTVSGSLPTTYIVTGLSKYTDYEFYFHYFGKIAGEDQNIISRSSLKKTDEDIPEAAPSSLTPRVQSSTSVQLSWGTIPDGKLWNGIALGYELQIRVKGAANSNWSSITTSGISNRQFVFTGLLKYTFYEFRVAGRTSKGSGVFSVIAEARTMEDVPSAPPLNITAQNTSSSSIVVAWDDVPADHQNGIILGYKVYVRKYGTDSRWSSTEVTVKTLSKSSLELWTLYSVKVSAKTSVGEGVISGAVTVRTDEDRPSGPPTNIKTIPASSQSINLTWSEIIPSKRHGIILSYKLKYNRTDGKDSLKEIITENSSIIIEDLAEDVNYDFMIAGVTIKGTGVFSSKVSGRTLEDAPDASPSNLRGHFNSSTAIQLYWEMVPEENRNGRIISYTLSYKKKAASGEWNFLNIDSSKLSLLVVGLDIYTIYELKIAASTSGGLGPFSSAVEIRTDADAPSKPPQNVTGHFLDHRSLEVIWNKVPDEFSHGIIEGYKIHFQDTSIPEQPWKQVIISSNTSHSGSFNATINELKIYTPYAIKMQAFTYKADGVLSNSIIVWTDEYTPEAPPGNITGQNSSSTEVILKWSDVAEINGDGNGKVLGYTVKYRVIDCHKDRPLGCDESQVFNITTNGSSPEIRVPGLRKFTQYSLSVQVFNSKGKGNFSKEINITTAEDTPDAPPTIVETWPSKTDSVKVYWSPIPESLRNGIILGYRIFYKSIDTPLRQYNRAPRAVNPLAVYGAEPGEGMKEVNATSYEVEIAELKDYSWYRIRIGALTSIGLGVTFSINGTTKQGRPAVAPDFQVTDMYGFHEMLLNWKAINRSLAKGEVLGYRIEFRLSELYEIPIPKRKVYFVDVLEPNRTVIIKKLSAFARYMFRILAFTEGGFGVWSDWKHGDTCRCKKSLSSARMILPPLVQESSLEILPVLLEEAVTSCCGNCTGRHGTSHVNWQQDANNASSIKYTRQEVINAVANGTNLALPIFKDTFRSEGDIFKSDYVFVPLIPSGQLAIFLKTPSKKDLGNAASSIVSNSIWEQYPVLVLSTVLAILAGIFFWILECGKNSESFSKSYGKGAGSGLWLAYITMTTVGYGDLVALTKFGRIYTVLWTLLGLVLTSILVGNISSIFNIEFAFNEASISTNSKVLTSEEALMPVAQLYGSKIKLGNVSDGKFVRDSLLSGNVSRVALDYYKAGTLVDFLDHPDIILESVEDIQATYGVILGRETKRLKYCISRHARENEQKILEQVSNAKLSFKVKDARDTRLVYHINSPDSDLMENLIRYGGIILAVLVVVGVMHDLVNFLRKRTKVDAFSSKLEHLSNEILKDSKKLEETIELMTKKIDSKHAEERLKLSNMQHGIVVSLLTKYPDLYKFDPEWKQLQKSNENPSLITGHDMRQEQQNSEEESDNDQQIDYKIDSYF